MVRRRFEAALFALATACAARCHPSRAAGADATVAPGAGGSRPAPATVGAPRPSAPLASTSNPASRSCAPPVSGPACRFATACAAASESPAAAAAEPPLSPPADPFGIPSTFGAYRCPNLQRGDRSHPHLSAADTAVAFVDGNDWLALVNRSPTGALSPQYAPVDLVDLKDGRPHPASECGAQRECLRRDAAAALHRMLDAMRSEGLEGYVLSAFRAFGTQCWVFDGWARQARGGFCEAAEQSALPGHSQHQLGTTLDLFTRSWADEGARTGRGVFRDGFGCTRGGRWLDEEAWRFGFVVPYAIHPDDRLDGSRCAARTDRPVPVDPKTGYKSEPWHVRFVGVETAARYHQDWLASGPGTPDEITIEQWIRTRRGLAGDTELPVCDGCHCGACATMAGDGARAPCGDASLELDGFGRVVHPFEDPRLLDARTFAAGANRPGAASSLSSPGASGEPAGGDFRVVVLEAVVSAPAHTPTQPPVFGRGGPAYDGGATYLALVPYAGTAPHRYPDLPGAWRLAVDTVPPTAAAHASPAAAPPPGTAAGRWPWRASIASPELGAVWNRANVLLPAQANDVRVRVSLAVPKSARTLSVTLLRDGVEHDTREVALP